MLSRGTLSGVLLVSICIAFQIGVPSCGFGQGAWIPPKGVGSFSISYQNNFSDRHSFGDGRDYLMVLGQKVTDNGGVRSQAAYLDFGYSFTDKLAVSFDLPYMQEKYLNPKTFPLGPDGLPNTGFGPHKFWDPSNPTIPPVALIDNQQYHGGFQNLGFRVRYNIATHPFMITPFLQYDVPSHAYPFYSHSVIGNRLAEFQIGTYVGGLVARNFYLSGGYGLGFPQRVLGISRTHHHLELEGGTFVTERIRAFGILHGQVTQGGTNLDQLPSSYNRGPVLFDGWGIPAHPKGYTSADEMMLHHLQTQRDSFLNMSVGMQYSLTGGVDIYGVLEHTLTNRNLHILKYGLTFGVSWGFGGSPQRPCHC